MKRLFRSNRVVASNLCLAPRSPSETARDPRAVRYFSVAASYNAAAADMGFPSLEHAVKAGQMREVVRRARLLTAVGVEA